MLASLTLPQAAVGSPAGKVLRDSRHVSVLHSGGNGFLLYFFSDGMASSTSSAARSRVAYFARLAGPLKRIDGVQKPLMQRIVHPEVQTPRKASAQMLLSLPIG
jgi:hypothetical protein